MVEGPILVVHTDMTRTLASDLGHMLSLSAIGAAVENAVIAATTEGLLSEVSYLDRSRFRQVGPRLCPLRRFGSLKGGP